MSRQPLTPEQNLAVKHGGGPLLIVAGAGTGKTRVITNRIAYLVEERGVNPYNILAVTFTNNAAEEMRQRLASMITGGFDELSIGTFHALSADILRDNAISFGISPFFKIVTDGERLLLMLEELERLNLSYHRVKGRPYGLLATLLQTVSKAKDELVTPEEYLDWAQLSRERLRYIEGDLTEKERLKQDEKVGKDEDVAAFYSRYNELLLQNDSLDFGDLIMSCVQLFNERRHILAEYQERWRYILVDEFQDTNLAQSRLVEMLAGEGKNICVVGDDDQSIYRFRGAAIANILQFRDRYLKATEIFLEDNYRSTGEILDGAYAVVKKNGSRLEKRLRPATGRSDPESLVLVQTESRAVEAGFIVKTIRGLIDRKADLHLDDFAVLARKRTDLRAVTKALASAGLSFNLAGGSGFFDRGEVKDIIAWARAVADPLEADAVIRTLEAEPFSLDPLECSRVNRWCREKKIYLIDGIDRVSEITDLDFEAAVILKSWRQILGRLMSRRGKVPADILLREILDVTGYRLPLMMRESLENIQKLANLAQLEQMAERFVSESGDQDLRRFIDYLHLMRAGGQDAVAEFNAQADSINLMSIHKAKGLEFRVVFMVGATDNTYPGKRKAEAIIPDELLKESTPPTQATHEAEMRRLFYVGCTRAMEKLFILYPAFTDDTGKELKRSRFLDEIIAQAAPPVINICAADVNFLGSDIVSIARKAQTSLLTAAGQGGILQADASDEAAAELLTRQLAAFFEVKKAYLAMTSENKDTEIEKIDALIDRLIQPNYRGIIKSPEFTARLLAAESETSISDRLSRLNIVDYHDFLPVNEQGGLTLTVSDILQYQNCPLAFKLKLIYQIPRVSSPEAEFGTFMHNVLQRFHSAYSREEATIENMFSLFDQGVHIRRLGRTAAERQLIERGREALTVYFADFMESKAVPAFFERDFRWRAEPHWITGRVDRADLLPGGGFELIDYKTGKAWQPKQVREDLQLSVYSLAATQSWEIEPELLSYYFLLDNKKMFASRGAEELEAARDTVLETAANIMAEKFVPKKDYIRCRSCDYAMLCRALESE